MQMVTVVPGQGGQFQSVVPLTKARFYKGGDKQSTGGLGQEVGEWAAFPGEGGKGGLRSPNRGVEEHLEERLRSGVLSASLGAPEVTLGKDGRESQEQREKGSAGRTEKQGRAEGKETCPEGFAFQVEAKGNRNMSHPRTSWPQIQDEMLGEGCSLPRGRREGRGGHERPDAAARMGRGYWGCHKPFPGPKVL